MPGAGGGAIVTVASPVLDCGELRGRALTSL